jgi:hypothetical protein
MSRPIMSDIEIDAPASVVFDTIMDTDAYPTWNPFTPRISLRSAEVVEGAEFELDCQMTESNLLASEREVILTVDHARRRLCLGTSRKHGRPFIQSFRWQICEPIDATRTRFMNFESFEGPLAPIVYMLYREKLGVAFNGFCRALKQHVEQGRKPLRAAREASS